MQHKMLFTSDVHGNEVQYQKLLDHAVEIFADSIVLGGDITPKNLSDETIINGQRQFLDKRLPKILSPLKRKLPNSRVFLILGNDDCAANLDVLEKREPDLFQIIHNKRVKLTEDFDILGYPYVPITQFGIKDWEKYDLSYAPKDFSARYELRKFMNYQLFGYKSTSLGWKEFRFDPEMEKTDSIQRDLSNESFRKDAGKTVYAFHAPPDQTNLDLLSDGRHAGSMAIELFIEKEQPYLTLHGHIHSTVKHSGYFKQQIGRTLCLASGNCHYGSELAVLVIDLYRPQNVVRKII
jgi:hypothetical protein